VMHTIWRTVLAVVSGIALVATAVGAEEHELERMLENQEMPREMQEEMPREMQQEAQEEWEEWQGQQGQPGQPQGGEQERDRQADRDDRPELLRAPGLSAEERARQGLQTDERRPVPWVDHGPEADVDGQIEAIDRLMGLDVLQQGNDREGGGPLQQDGGGGTRTRGGGKLPPGGVNRPSGSGGVAGGGECPLGPRTFKAGTTVTGDLTKCVSNPYSCDPRMHMQEELMLEAFCKLKMTSTCDNKCCEDETQDCVPDVAESAAKLNQHLTPKGPVGWFAVAGWEIYLKENTPADEIMPHAMMQATTKSCTRERPYMCVWRGVTLAKSAKCKCSCK
jgi:hypothetical protein